MKYSESDALSEAVARLFNMTKEIIASNAALATAGREIAETRATLELAGQEIAALKIELAAALAAPRIRTKPMKRKAT